MQNTIIELLENTEYLDLSDFENLTNSLTKSLNKLKKRSLINFIHNILSSTEKVRNLKIFQECDNIDIHMTPQCVAEKRNQDYKTFISLSKFYDGEVGDNYEYEINIILVNDIPRNIIYETDRYFYYDYARDRDVSYGTFQGLDFKDYCRDDIYKDKIKSTVDEIRELAKLIENVQYTGKYL